MVALGCNGVCIVCADHQRARQLYIDHFYIVPTAVIFIPTHQYNLRTKHETQLIKQAILRMYLTTDVSILFNLYKHVFTLSSTQQTRKRSRESQSTVLTTQIVPTTPEGIIDLVKKYIDSPTDQRSTVQYIEDLLARNESLTAANESLTAANASLTEAKESLVATTESLNSDLKETTTRYQDSLQALKDSNGFIKEKDAVIANLENTLSEVRTSIETLNGKLQKELDEKNVIIQHCESMTESINTLTSSATSHQVEMENITRTNTALSNEVTNLTKQVDELNKFVSDEDGTSMSMLKSFKAAHGIVSIFSTLFSNFSMQEVLLDYAKSVSEGINILVFATFTSLN